MIRSSDAIRAARALIGTPYSEVDCIGLIKRVVRTAPGGVPGYTTAGTNTLWRSFDAAAKYKDLTWRQEGIVNAHAGMLAFKRSGDDVHHVGLVTEGGTVVHASSAAGEIVETPLDSSWHLLAQHRHIAVESAPEQEVPMYTAKVTLEDPTSALNLRDGPAATDRKIGSLRHGVMLEVLAEAGDWRFVRAGSQLGYVSAAYLQRVGEDESDVGKPADAGKDIHVSTTLMNEDGVAIRLEGRWRVAED